jgi:general secretion pathway protein G
MKPIASKRRARRGFTLIELIIVMSLIAVLAGVLTPAVSSIMRSQARGATIQEMQLLAEAIQAYYRDTRQFPTAVTCLMSDTVPGWSGPYLSGTVDDPWSAQSGYVVDGFGNDYRLAAAGLALTLSSDGPDRTAGNADDIDLVVNVTPILRGLTLAELDVINTAIVQYNATFVSTNPLPANWPVALSMLESRGYLPTGSGYGADEWGAAYVEVPTGTTPVTEVTSVNVGP